MRTLEDVTAALPRTVCKICCLPEDIRDQIAANYRKPDNERASHGAVARWLRNDGDFDISDSAVKRHAYNHLEYITT